MLGLGDIGPLAALPVMEGKAALFKRFADIDAFPICLDTTDTEEIIRTVKAISPVFAGINLEDISAPRCFEIEARLREELDIPVFHDDQHGTAIVALAALRNALRVVGKRLEDVRLVMSGAGAAGTAILKLFLHAGARHVVVADVDGVVHRGRADVLSGEHPNHAWIAEHTNPDDVTGTLSDAMRGADVFLGVSAPNILTEADVASMAPDSVVFAMANPVPEIDPDIAARHAAVVATGRSDFANQINNVLVFPGVFRGLIDSGVSHVDMDVLLAAADALADVVHEDERNATYIIPSVFHPDVSTVVAEAVRAAVAAREPRVSGAGEGAAVAAAGAAGRGASGRPGCSVLLAVAVAVQLVVLYAPEGGGAPPFPQRRQGRARARVPRAGRRRAARRLPAAAGRAASSRRTRCVSEVVQAPLLPHRSGDPLDVVADLTGVGARRAGGWRRRCVRARAPVRGPVGRADGRSRHPVVVWRMPCRW